MNNNKEAIIENYLFLYDFYPNLSIFENIRTTPTIIIFVTTNSEFNYLSNYLITPLCPNFGIKKNCENIKTPY